MNDICAINNSYVEENFSYNNPILYIEKYLYIDYAHVLMLLNVQ